MYLIKKCFQYKSLVTPVSHSKPWIALYLITSSVCRVEWNSDSPWQPTHGEEGM